MISLLLMIDSRPDIDPQPTADDRDDRVEQNVDEILHSWMDFIHYCADSDFFQEARDRGLPLQDAAVLTLLWTYIGTFSLGDREEIENDVEKFYKYAKSFLDELSPFRYHSKDYDPAHRAMYLGRIRSVLKDFKNRGCNLHHGEYSKMDAGISCAACYEFLSAIVRYTSSEDYIVKAYDLYRQYMFRRRPKSHSMDFDFHI